MQARRPDILAPTIFHQPWWLDIAGGGACKEVTVTRGNRLVGRLPYLESRTRLGLVVLGMPALSHVLGPALDPQYAGENFPKSLKQMSILHDLLAGLPKAAHISFCLHGGLNNTLAFEVAGFSTEVRFTMEVMPAPVEELWRGMRDKTRNVIRRAQERLSVSELCTPGEFIDFYDRNLRVRKTRNHYDRALVQTLITECLARGCGRVQAARDGAGRLQAAVFTVWDDTAEYYFMSTRSAEAHNGAVNWLIWEAIQHAARKGLVFDLDMVHVVHAAVPNLLLVTGFGGKLVPRYRVHRSSPMVRLGKYFKKINPVRRWTYRWLPARPTRS